MRVGETVTGDKGERTTSQSAVRGTTRRAWNLLCCIETSVHNPFLLCTGSHLLAISPGVVFSPSLSSKFFCVLLFMKGTSKRELIN